MLDLCSLPARRQAVQHLRAQRCGQSRRFLRPVSTWHSLNDQECRSIVTPEQAGYVQGQVRCENCSWYDDGTCGLYQMLMEKMPDVFDLETSVEAQGCCNAWQKG